MGSKDELKLVKGSEFGAWTNGGVGLGLEEGGDIIVIVGEQARVVE
jgi:hypothetical protein